MNEENKTNPEQAADAADTLNTQEAEQAPAANEPESQILAEVEQEAAKASQIQADVEEKITALEEEVATLKDKLLRAMAETENVRRRAERSRQDASKYAIANFARDMVVVADNLNRALDSVDGEARQKNEALESLCVGIEMTNRELLAAFERVDIKPIDALGQPFDHNLHEAMFELEDKNQPAGTVMHVMEAGFTIGERLLRPAKVGVSKGGPKRNGAAAVDASSEAESKASQAYGAANGATGEKLDEKL